jgi:DNA-binding NtrC family response regulator
MNPHCCPKESSRNVSYHPLDIGPLWRNARIYLTIAADQRGKLMPLRVLLVDDSPESLLGLSQALQLRLPQATISMAASADEALNVMNTLQFDVVLSDVRMPGRSGMDLLQEVKARHPETIVFLMTGCENGQREAALKAGASGFLDKPLDIKRLVHLLTSACDQARLQKALQERNRQSLLGPDRN